MTKGNQFTAPLADTNVSAARTAINDLQAKLAFVPQQPESLLTSATISPERLPLANLALQAAGQAPQIMRKAADPEQFRTKILGYRALVARRNQLAPELIRIDNAMNVLGSNIRFHVNNVHEDIETDKGETIDLGQLRQDINAYYAKSKGGKGGGSAPKPQRRTTGRPPTRLMLPTAFVTAVSVGAKAVLLLGMTVLVIPIGVLVIGTGAGLATELRNRCRA